MTRSMTRNGLWVLAFAAIAMASPWFTTSAQAGPYRGYSSYRYSYCPSPGYSRGYSRSYSRGYYGSRSKSHYRGYSQPRYYHHGSYRHYRSSPEYSGHIAYGSHGHNSGVHLSVGVRGHSGQYKSGYTSYPKHVETTYVAPEPTYAYESVNYSGLTHGWDLLEKGQASRAMIFFSERAQRHPKDGRPKVGYALSAGTKGEHDRGVWAMRRALRYNPSALDEVPRSSLLASELEELREQYEYRAGHDDADAHFMVAALSYMLHDNYAAMDAVDKALALGADRASLLNLQQLVDTRMERDKAYANKD